MDAIVLEPVKHDVYRNLHRKCWSIRDSKTRLVKDHSHNVTLENPTFHVGAGGRERVRREGRKNVHAFVRGLIVPLAEHVMNTNGERITYNPYENDGFVYADTGLPVVDENIKYVHLTASGLVFVT